MEMTLLLNSTFEPLRVVHWQKAIALLWQGKVEVLEVYDREVHGVSISFTDVRSCGADRQGGAEDLGKHCDRLLALQQQKERPYSRRSRHAADEKTREAALESDCHHHHWNKKHTGKLAGLPVLEYGIGRRSLRLAGC